MLQKLGDYVTNCLVRAAEAERRASEASNEAMRIDDEQMARGWRLLASSYQFVESLERFLLESDKGKGARPPIEEEGPIFPPRGTIFDPNAIAVLTAAYDKAIEGQSASVHEVIAKRIIDLACEGERDADKLCQGALALSIRDPRPSWSTCNRISGIAAVKILRP